MRKRLCCRITPERNNVQRRLATLQNQHEGPSHHWCKKQLNIAWFGKTTTKCRNFWSVYGRSYVEFSGSNGRLYQGKLSTKMSAMMVCRFATLRHTKGFMQAGFFVAEASAPIQNFSDIEVSAISEINVPPRKIKERALRDARREQTAESREQIKKSVQRSARVSVSASL